MINTNLSAKDATKLPGKGIIYVILLHAYAKALGGKNSWIPLDL